MAKRNPTFAKQLVVIELNRKLKEELAERYEFTSPPVVEEFPPLETNDERMLLLPVREYLYPRAC